MPLAARWPASSRRPATNGALPPSIREDEPAFHEERIPMKRTRVPAIVLLSVLVSAAVMVCSKTDEGPRIARVENGLRSPVVIKGDPAWNILERMRRYKVPGVSVAVFDGRRVLWAKGYGVMDSATKEPVTERTLFVAGSISKPVAAMGALKLVEEGKIGLDRNINDALTSWKLPE